MTEMSYAEFFTQYAALHSNGAPLPGAIYRALQIAKREDIAKWFDRMYPVYADDPDALFQRIQNQW